ncbi:MAG: right-handed parallel beta-helix repeat-containing protein [Nitrospirota bacterium]
MKRTIKLLGIILLSAFTLFAFAVSLAASPSEDMIFKDTRVDVRSFSNLAAAIGDPSTVGKTIVVSNIQSCGNMTIPGNRGIEVVQGGRIDPLENQTVKIEGPFQAGLSRAFGGKGAVIFGKGSVKEVYLEWTGAVGNDFADDTFAIQKAFASAVHVKRIWLNAKTYKMTQALLVPDGVEIHSTSGDSGTLKFYNCDGLILSSSHGIGPYVLNNFGVQGNSGGRNSFTGIQYKGGADTAVRTTGLRIHNVRVHWFGTGISLRNAWSTNIANCTINNVYNGIKILGQSVKITLRDNDILSNPVLGTGGSVGVYVDSAFDYNPGGKTEHRPENITIDNNWIYGFDKGCQFYRGLEGRIIHNDFDNSNVIGIELIGYDGNMLVDDNWIAASVANTPFVGIKVYAVYTPINNMATISNNHLLGRVGKAGSIGIHIAQNNVNVYGNTMKLFSDNDIKVETVGDINIRDNHCYSSGLSSSSIYVANTPKSRFVTIDGNTAIDKIYVHPIANAGIVNVGKNSAQNATHITGYVTMPQGRVTTGPIAYSSLIGGFPNFDTVHTGLKPFVRLFADSSNLDRGFTYAVATDTDITINSTAPYASGDYRIYFEISVIPTFMTK